MSKRNPNIIEFAAAVQDHLQDRMRTCVPATVVSYDQNAQTITAQPSPNYGTEPHALVYDVPVLFPSGGGWSISWGLNPGDPVHLLVSDRPLEGFRDGDGKPYTITEKRKHNISDAEALPAAGPVPDPISGLSSNFIIRGPSGVHIEIELITGNVIVDGNVILAGANASLATGGVAIAQLVHTYLLQLFTALGTAPMDGGATLKSSGLAFINANPFTAFASSKLFAEQ